MKKVSIIIPAFNVGEYLERCLNSVLNQTYKNIEVFIVNDGSIDNTEEIALKYCNKYDNFNYIKKENGGVSSARNMALERATGEYIAFIDSDDWVNDTFIESLVNSIRDDDSFCQIGEFQSIKPNSNTIHKITRQLTELFTMPAVTSKLYNKKFIDKLNLKFGSTSIGEDLEFTLKLYIFNEKFSIAPNSTYYYFYNDKSLMHTYTRHIFSVIEAIENIEKFAKQQNKFDELYSTLEFINIFHILIGLLKNASKIEDFKEEEIKDIKKYVDKKYPNWIKNPKIENLSKEKQEYLKNLNDNNIKEVLDFYRG